jgi:hypothetical protein
VGEDDRDGRLSADNGEQQPHGLLADFPNGLRDGRQEDECRAKNMSNPTTDTSSGTLGRGGGTSIAPMAIWSLKQKIAVGRTARPSTAPQPFRQIH